MGKFSDLFKEADKSGLTKLITPEYHEWTKSGDFLIGRLQTVVTVNEDEPKKAYCQYLLESDKGLVKFALGSATDKELAFSFVPGLIYRIEYRGQEKISGGRFVNKFLAYVIIEPPEPVDQEAAGVPA
jgi:predicted nucleotidyltransferase